MQISSQSDRHVIHRSVPVPRNASLRPLPTTKLKADEETKLRQYV